MKNQYQLPPEVLKALEDMNNPASKAETEEKPESDKDTITCTKCNSNKVRIFKKKFPSGVIQYVAEDGRQWKGKHCPDCVKVMHRNYMRGLRGTKKPRV